MLWWENHQRLLLNCAKTIHENETFYFIRVFIILAYLNRTTQSSSYVFCYQSRINTTETYSIKQLIQETFLSLSFSLPYICMWHDWFVFWANLRIGSTYLDTSYHLQEYKTTYSIPMPKKKVKTGFDIHENSKFINIISMSMASNKYQQYEGKMMIFLSIWNIDTRNESVCFSMNEQMNTWYVFHVSYWTAFVKSIFKSHSVSIQAIHENHSGFFFQFFSLSLSIRFIAPHGTVDMIRDDIVWITLKDCINLRCWTNWTVSFECIYFRLAQIFGAAIRFTNTWIVWSSFLQIFGSIVDSRKSCFLSFLRDTPLFKKFFKKMLDFFIFRVTKINFSKILLYSPWYFPKYLQFSRNSHWLQCLWTGSLQLQIVAYLDSFRREWIKRED